MNSEKEQKIMETIPISIREELAIQIGFAKEIMFTNYFDVGT